jgi:hypothetical protein
MICPAAFEFEPAFETFIDVCGGMFELVIQCKKARPEFSFPVM